MTLIFTIMAITMQDMEEIISITILEEETSEDVEMGVILFIEEEEPTEEAEEELTRSLRRSIRAR
jgi:hypothetical protein